MNATCKRLLSWLIVLTMVLSMVPVFDLSNFAVTTKAADYVNPGQEVIDAAKALETEKFPDGVEGTVMAVCPVCSHLEENPVTTEVEWKPLASGSATSSLHGHYYLSGNITTQISVNTGIGRLCLNLNGYNVTVASAAAISPSNATVNIIDTAKAEGTVSGYATSYGSAIHINGAGAKGTANIYGGTYTKAANATAAAIVGIGGNGGTINMYAGTLTAQGITNTGYPTVAEILGKSTNHACFNMYGGNIYGGTQNGVGGAIRVGDVGAGYANGAFFTLYDGTVSGGKTTGQCGGNFYVNYSGTLTVKGGTISGGETNGSYSSSAYLGGGNIALANGGMLNVEGGTISGGVATKGAGGNIYVRDNTYGTITISGGKIIDGTAVNGGGNICVKTTAASKSALTISGGQISGDIVATDVTAITLSGAPVIKTSGITGSTVTGTIGLNVTGTSNIDVDGLTSGAEIQVSGDKDVVFTKTGEDASGVARYFTHVDSALMVKANDSKQLYIAEYEALAPVDPPNKDFAPQDWNGRAWCPVCESYETWKAVTNNANTGNMSGHCYLAEDIVTTTTLTIWGSTDNELCLNLNGCDITATDHSALGLAVGTVNIMDIAGGSVVSGYGEGYAAGAAISVSNANSVLSLHGGTFTKADNATTCSVVVIGTNGGTIYMYDGATIDAEDITNTAWASTVSVQGKAANPATFNMKGGVIKCGNMSAIHANYMGNINLGYANMFKGAFFNMEGGTIYGGACDRGGAIAVIMQNSLDISGGTIVNGKSDAKGGNIYTNAADTNVTISGGTIVGQIYINNGNLTVSKDAKVVKTLTIGEETFTATAGMEVEAAANATVKELTANAEIYLSGKTDIALVSVDGTVTTANLKAFNTRQFVDFVNSEAYLKQINAAIAGTGVEEPYADAQEALNAYYANPNGYVKLYAEAELALNGNAYIDANGNTVKVTGTGKLYAMDSANDEYDADAVGTWTVTGPEVVNDVINPVNGRRYIVIQDGEGYTAHRIEMYLPTVTLRSSNAGIYFHASYKCDTTLAARVGDYGVALSALDNVDTTLENVRNVNSGVKLTVLSKFAEAMDENTVSSTSSLVKNIFKKDATNNNARGDITIKATPYFVVDINGDGSSINDYNGEAYYVVGNAEGYEIDDAIKGATYASVTMNSVLTKVNWATLTEDQKNYILAWADWGVTLPGNIG